MGTARTLAAGLTTAAVGAALVVATPAAAGAAVAPKITSAKAKMPVVKVDTGDDVAVPLVAVVSDPDGVVNRVTFTAVGPGNQTFAFGSDSTGSGPASARVYEADLTDRSSDGAGQRKVTVAVELTDGADVSGWAGATRTTSYTLRVVPLLAMYQHPGRSSAKRVAFAGHLTGYLDNAGRKVVVQFKSKGKKWKKKQVVRTKGHLGAYGTKRFKIKKTGKWRVKVKRSGPYLGTRSTPLKIKKGRLW